MSWRTANGTSGLSPTPLNQNTIHPRFVRILRVDFGLVLVLARGVGLACSAGEFGRDFLDSSLWFRMFLLLFFGFGDFLRLEGGELCEEDDWVGNS